MGIGRVSLSTRLLWPERLWSTLILPTPLRNARSAIISSRSNHPTRDVFHCICCVFSCPADTIAARNIAAGVSINMRPIVARFLWSHKTQYRWEQCPPINWRVVDDADPKAACIDHGLINLWPERRINKKLVELWLVIFVNPNVRTLAYEQIRPESRQTPVPVQNQDGLEVFGSGGTEKF